MARGTKKGMEVPMIGAAQNVVRSLCSSGMQVAPSRAINHIRGKCGQHLAATSVRLNPQMKSGLLVKKRFPMEQAAQCVAWQEPTELLRQGTIRIA
jgi:hypothetical protein